MGGIGDISGGLHRKATGGSVRVARVRKENTTDKPKRPESGKRAAGTPAKKRKLVRSESPPEEFDSVWEALGFSPEETANLQTRSRLMMEIEKVIEEGRWTQAAAARRCGVSQPRINDLLRGHIDRFSIDALVNMAAALGCKIQISVEAA